MLEAELRVTSGKQTGSAIKLPTGKFLVGREEDCHLRPNSDLVSRHHCVFTLDEYGLRLRDLGSTNGSFVNGEKIRGAVVLNAGDAVSIGKLDFQVILGDPITDETRTNLQNDLPTETFPAPPNQDSKEQDTTEQDTTEQTPEEAVPQQDFSPEDDDTLPENASVSDTLMEMPTSLAPDVTLPLQPDLGEQPAPPQQPPSTGETQYFPPQGTPQMPVGYPPQMGYPQGMAPPYGYPPQGYPPQGYPAYPPNMGYPPGMYPPQQPAPIPEPAAAEETTPQVNEPEVRLPDPSQTGVKEPEPAPPQVESSDEEKTDERTTDQKSKEEAPNAAANAIQQYLQRRPKTGG